MNFETWKSKINKLEINPILKPQIINFFENFTDIKSNIFAVIKITNKKLIESLYAINNYKPFSICLDIEFQTAIIENNNNKYIISKNNLGDDTAKFIRELGLIFFINEPAPLNNWYYIGYIFVNFPQLTKYNFPEKNISLIKSTYSTITTESKKQMESNEKLFRLDTKLDILLNRSIFQNNKKEYNQEIDLITRDLQENILFQLFMKESLKNTVINNILELKKIRKYPEAEAQIKFIKKALFRIQFDIYGKYLIGKYYEVFSKTNKLYWNNALVKDRVKFIKNNEKLFLSSLNILCGSAILVIKGQMDIISIKNMFNLIFDISGFDNIILDKYYDIETFNGISDYLFGGSQLKDTYQGLIQTKTYNKYAKSIFDEIKNNIVNNNSQVDKAHNPVMDCLFTIIVAVIFNLGLNIYFGQTEKIQVGSNINQILYKKYKKKYLDLKGSYLL